LGKQVELEPGRFGQFDILVGGRAVVSRKGGLLAKLMGKPWPSDEEVVKAVADAMQATG
jgi:hypothetical protein